MFLKLYESKILFFKKHRGKIGVLAYKVLLGLVAVSRILGSYLAKWYSQDRGAEYDEIASQYSRLAVELWQY